MTRAIRALSWLHRWTGVGLCLLFALWFASGAVLIFVPFPGLGDQDRLAASERVDPAAIIVPPARALQIAGGGESARLIAAGGRTLYVVQTAKGNLEAIDARSGQVAAPVDRALAGRIAARFAKAEVRSIDGPLAYDQWIVHQRFDPWRPFFRVAVNDAAGTELYVSARTGEIVQRTTTVARGWNWAGAVTHWLYFTALRQSFTAWDQTVWWVSLVGLGTAIAGAILGVYRTQKRLGGRRPDWSPFHGWLRWHHGLGLGAAVFVLTWIFSGWLSMDHGRLFSRGEPTARESAAYRGATLARAFAGVTPSQLAGLDGAAEIDLGVLAGRPFAAAQAGDAPARVRLLQQGADTDLTRLPDVLLTAAAARAWPVASRTPEGPLAGDRLYREAEGMDPRVVRLPLASPQGGWVYLDPVTGRVIVVMNPSRQGYAWVYYALHTFKFPGLIDHPALRQGLELLLVALGFGFSVTGVVIAVKRLRIATAR